MESRSSEHVDSCCDKQSVIAWLKSGSPLFYSESYSYILCVVLSVAVWADMRCAWQHVERVARLYCGSVLVW